MHPLRSSLIVAGGGVGRDGRDVPGTFSGRGETRRDAVSSLGPVEINRARLLAGSLVVAVLVSAIGGYVWSQTIADDDPTVDAVLRDPQDRTVPTDGSAFEIVPNDDVQGDVLPDATVIGPDGDEVSTASFLGEPLVINFWFSSCVPCAKELPEFAEVDAELGDEVRFIGINMQDSVPVMERFAGERGVTYDLYQDADAEATIDLGLAAFPQTIFVTSDGEIVEQTGVVDADDLRTKIADLLEKDTA